MAKAFLPQKVDASVDPYTHAAWVHHSFICIHPFVDGNGRTARLLASIPLMHAGLPPLNVFAEDSREYYAALTTVRPPRPAQVPLR